MNSSTANISPSIFSNVMDHIPSLTQWQDSCQIGGNNVAIVPRLVNIAHLQVPVINVCGCYTWMPVSYRPKPLYGSVLILLRAVNLQEAFKRSYKGVLVSRAKPAITCWCKVNMFKPMHTSQENYLCIIILAIKRLLNRAKTKDTAELKSWIYKCKRPVMFPG